MKRNIKKEKGITLVALVVTIVILLILAGVSLNLVFGSNGIVSKAGEAREEQCHGSIRDIMSMKYSEYNMKKSLEEIDENFMSYIQDEGNLTADGSINTVKFLGKKVFLGNGSDKKDVYVLEEKDDEYVVNYYDKDGKLSKEVWNVEVPISTASKRDESMFEFDSTTGTILRIKRENLIDYYAKSDPYSEWGDYMNERSWCKIEDGIGTLIVPSSINGVAVKYVKFLGVINVDKIVFESGIEKIGYICMGNEEKTQLKEVDIPNTVTTIEDKAFYYCDSLKKIYIPESVVSIGNETFMHCSGLISIAVNEKNTVYDSRDNCNALIQKGTDTLIIGCKNTVIPSGTKQIADGAFLECSGLKSIAIPESVTEIGNYSFAGCTGIEQITVDEKNTVYDSRDNCNALIQKGTDTLIMGCKNTVIPSGTKQIADDAFIECLELKSIAIPESVTEIGSYSFAGCTGIEQITVDEKNTVYDSRKNCNAIIEKEHNMLLKGCNNTTIPNDIEIIGPNAFMNCDTLTSVTIPNSVTTIGSSAFAGCTSLNDITISGGVTQIEDYTFWGCTGLSSITLPESLITIGNNAFYECTSLSSITIPNSVTTIGSYAFEGCTSLNDITISGGVTQIEDYAFMGCTGLNSITLPESLITIGYGAFSKCTSLRSITIPNSVTTIKGVAFCYCANLNSVIFEDTENWYYQRLKKDVSDPASNAKFLLEGGNLTKNSN